MTDTTVGSAAMAVMISFADSEGFDVAQKGLRFDDRPHLLRVLQWSMGGHFDTECFGDTRAAPACWFRRITLTYFGPYLVESCGFPSFG